MISGEIHYFRIEPRRFDALLKAAKEIGVDTVGTYIPWNVHEIKEGIYDFSLLEDFIARVKKAGLKMFARPGPYIYAEWRNLGVPDHAAALSKMHPEFRRKASRWIAAVMKALRPYLGDPIVIVQADNEIDPMLHFYGEDLGFAAWLKDRYKTVDRLNEAWGTALESFGEARPFLAPLPRPSPADSPAARRRERRFRDGCRYRYDLASEYARWIVGEYRKKGCTVPILLNTWPGVDAQNWAEFSDIADLFGIDIYPSDGCRADFAFFLERLRLLRAVTPRSFIAEFASGFWREEGGAAKTFSPDHYRLTAWAALAAGVRGWNWYMLAGRDNWAGAPINERGVTDPRLRAAFADASAAFRALEGAPPPEVSCGVTWSWPSRQAAEVRRLGAGDSFFAAVHGLGSGREDPLLAALADLGMEYDFIDADGDFQEQTRENHQALAALFPGTAGEDRRRPPPPILFFCGEMEDPARLLRYVESGGNLVFFQRLMAGIPEPVGTSHPFAKHLALSLGFETKGPVFSFSAVPGEPITAVQQEWDVDADQRIHMKAAAGRTYLTGFHQKRGKGSVTVLGCPPSPEAIFAIHRFFGIAIPVRSMTPGVHVAKRGDRIVVVNAGEAETARIVVATGKKGGDGGKKNGENKGVTTKILDLRPGRKKGKKGTVIPC